MRGSWIRIYFLFFLLLEGIMALLPVVVWHSLGSSCCDDSTTEFISILRQQLPRDAEIIPIRIGDTPVEDSYKSYFDNANRQVDEVCSALKQNPALIGGFNAIGLSQGGLLLRALVERCEGIKVNTLITLGAPLMGVAAYPGCGRENKWAKMRVIRVFRGVSRKIREKLLPCSLINALVGSSVYSPKVQSTLMPAQYFKDPKNIPTYLQANNFLADINNEKPRKNAAYKRNLSRLNKFVVISFEDEEIVFPKESTNFGYYEDSELKPLRDLTIYKQDWIGLKELDRRKALIQVRFPGEHLEVNEAVMRTIRGYLN